MSIHSRRDRWIRSLCGIALLAAIVVVAGLVYGGSSSTSERVFILFAINLVVALGLQTFMGLTGVVSFGHIAFMAIGAYAAGLMTTSPLLKSSAIPDAPTFIQNAEMGFLPGTAVAVLVTCLVGALIGIAIVRLSGTAATISTYALLVIVGIAIVNLPDLTRGNQTFYGIPKETTLGMAIIFAVAAIAVARIFQDSRIGLLLRASREDMLSAAGSGVDVRRYRLYAWVLSIAIVAAGGSLYGHYVSAISPAAFSLQLTFVVVTMVIVGGRGTSGALVGAILVTAINEVMRQFNGQISIGPIDTEVGSITPLILGTIVIAIMTRRPGGLLGERELDDLLVKALDRVRSARKPVPDSPVTKG